MTKKKETPRTTGIESKSITSSSSVSIPNVAINTFMNYVPSEGSINVGKSLTMPNDVLSVQEIIARSARGLPLEQGDSGFYDVPEGVFIPDDYDTWDAFDREMFLRDQGEDIRRQQEEELEELRKQQQDEIDQFNKWREEQLASPPKDEGGTPS